MMLTIERMRESARSSAQVGRAAGLVIALRKADSDMVVGRGFEQDAQRNADGQRRGLRRAGRPA
ncbi:MAG TPA: hypothetical protein DDW72_16165, partial [Afipia sp.]|nr:hypothetical protein [Afipia sp.]